jgi:GxxExxY protein
MNVNEHESKTLEAVIGAAYEVANHLGGGFLEKVYERSLEHECRLRGLTVRAQVRCPVRYKGRLVGDYVADLVVDGSVVVELKCVDAIAKPHVGQCLNYLKASGLRVALLVNFQRSKVEWRRVLLDFVACSPPGSEI